jgi:hypothetical protein
MHDVYENLALKRLLGLQQLLTNTTFDFVCCVDTDTYINFNNIKRMEANIDIESNYGVLLSTTGYTRLKQKRTANKIPFLAEKTIFPAGGGYIISRKSLSAINFSSLIGEVQQNIDKNIDMSYEDVIMGVALSRANQKLYHNGFWIDRTNHCFASCCSTFLHTTNLIDPKKLKAISLLY